MQDLNNNLANLPNQIRIEMARFDAALRGTTIEEEQAKALQAADFAERISKMEADPNSQLSQDKRADERAEAKRREDRSRREAELASKKTAALNDGKYKTDTQEQEKSRAEALVKQKQEADNLKAQQDRENKRIAAEIRAREIRDEIERKRQAALEEARQKVEKEKE